MAEAICAAIKALLDFLTQGLDKRLSPERLARVGSVLLESEPPGSVDPLFLWVGEQLLSAQRPDGGWLNVEETAWCVKYLKKMPVIYAESVGRGCEWLRGQQNADEGWGESGRDQSRIPYTAWVSILLPELTTQGGLLWLERETIKEARHRPMLTYKLALPLLAFKANGHRVTGNGLPVPQLDTLVASQEEDGGFGPWWGHPCGSDPWCTAVASLALLSYEAIVAGSVLEKSLEWILSRQLDNGLWPYHYIDEGSGLAYYALTKLVKWKKQRGLL